MAPSAGQDSEARKAFAAWGLQGFDHAPAPHKKHCLDSLGKINTRFRPSNGVLWGMGAWKRSLAFPGLYCDSARQFQESRRAQKGKVYLCALVPWRGVPHWADCFHHLSHKWRSAANETCLTTADGTRRPHVSFGGKDSLSSIH